MIVLLALSGFFSSSETAFFSLNPLHLRRMEEKHPAGGKRVSRILERPTRLLATVLVGNTIVNVCASSLAFDIAETWMPSRGEIVAVPVMTLLLLIFGEIGPKRIAMLRSEQMALFYARVLPVMITTLSPLRFLVEGITHRMEPWLKRRSHALTEEEFASAIDLGSESGVLDQEEGIMVKAILRLEDLQASDVMTPRVDIKCIDLEENPLPGPDILQSMRRRKVALYRKSMDNLVGFLDVQQYLLKNATSLEDAVIEPLRVPETAQLDCILEDFRLKKSQVAAVIDEYGGIAGMITRGDILKEIVGGIDDEYQQHRELLEKLGKTRWLADGSINIEELRERTGIALASDGFDRLAGWIASELQRIPRAGDEVEAHGCRATVRHVERNRATLVVVERIETSI